MTSPLSRLRHRLASFGDTGRRRVPLLRRVPPLPLLIELAARVGYGARGLVYLSVGALTLGAALGWIGEAVGTRGSIVWLSQQPLGRLWLLLLGLGLAAFVFWRVLQAVFDADHEGLSREGLGMRFGQAVSGLTYAALAITTFHMLIDRPENANAADVERSRQTAEQVLSMPFGNWLLIAGGLVLFGIGIVNVSRAWREDFTEYLACSERTCRRIAPLAQAGYIARGLAWLPLAFLVIMAGWRKRPSDATSFGAALDAIDKQPAGEWILALTAFGFIAFGIFSFAEARFRRIRPPRDLSLSK